MATTVSRFSPPARAGERATAHRNRHRHRHRHRGWFGTALGLVVVVVLVRWLVVSVHVVDSGSMTPTAEEGDVVVVDRLTPRWSAVGRGDLVVFEGPDRPYLKRVVGVAGDAVVIRDAVLFVNGEAVSEPYVDHERIDALFTERVVVPDGHVYVLGDARDNSVDSRQLGPVDLDDVVGRAAWVF